MGAEFIRVTLLPSLAQSPQPAAPAIWDGESGPRLVTRKLETRNAATVLGDSAARRNRLPKFPD